MSQANSQGDRSPAQNSKRISIVVSQGHSKNPQKRDLEEGIVTGLMFEPGFDVTVVPNLYDLKPDGTGLLALQGIRGNVIVCSWLFERAAHWILDRNGIHGHQGTTLLKPDSEEDWEDDELEGDDDDKDRVIDSRELPNRKIYCLDLKVSESVEDYIDEIRRIRQECSVKVVELGGLSFGSAFQNGSNNSANGSPAVIPTDDAGATNGSTSNGSISNGAVISGAVTSGEAAAKLNGNGQAAADAPEVAASSNEAGEVHRVDEKSARRWYPVIDYSRCTNCMECIDFCLFGVYGIDSVETILVEQPDNCRKGCPACSRVCPENAIMFPQHKTPAIAGSDDAVSGLKIDLSKLFGAPEGGKDALEVAVLERDEQLQQAGRDSVGMSVGVPKRQTGEANDERDELDDLIDQLDDLDL